MSFLCNVSETASWIAAWRAEGKRGQRMIARAAAEQRANLNSIRGSGRSPSWCDVNEYSKCVDLLEAEVKKDDAKE